MRKIVTTVAAGALALGAVISTAPTASAHHQPYKSSGGRVQNDASSGYTIKVTNYWGYYDTAHTAYLPPGTNNMTYLSSAFNDADGFRLPGGTKARKCGTSVFEYFADSDGTWWKINDWSAFCLIVKAQ